MKQKKQKPTLRLWRWGNDKFKGYKIFTIFYCKFFDIYLFKYPEGSFIPKHKDPGNWHYRFNIFFGKGRAEFICKKAIINNKFISLFRADKYYHRTTAVKGGNRYVLSFGLKL